jgi:LPS-assembly protein
VNLEPRLSLPLRRGGYLELEPFVGLLETGYLIEHYDEPEDSRVRERTFHNRTLYETGMEAATEIVGIFKMGGDTWTKMRHTVRPQILYEYRPKVSQNKLPSFDSTDRVERRNRITYSLVNFFNARLDYAPGELEYHDFARLEFSQFYDLRRPEESTSRAFSNVFTQLDFTPKRFVRFTYKNQYSPYDGDFKSHELLAHLWNQRGDKLTVDYRRQLDEDGKTILDEIGTQLTLNLWEGVSFNMRSDYDLKRTRNIKSEYNIMLQRQCWGISVSYVDDPGADERRVALGISLYGVGELETQTYSSGD